MAVTQAPTRRERFSPPPVVLGPILALAALGALVLIPLLLLATIPVVITLGLVLGGVVLLALSLWAGIEGLAAFERWLERDPRFRR